MKNIKFKGFYKNEEQLRQVSLPTNSIQFKEPDNIDIILLKGLVKSLPFLLSSLLIAGYTVLEIFATKHPDKDSILFAFLIGCFIQIPLVFVHEIIHALFFPAKALKEIYISENLKSAFVYCTAPVSKLRFIIICIAPAAVLGIIPLPLSFLLRNILNAQIACILSFTGFLSILPGIGDFLNIYMAIEQVPGNARIMGKGLHSFWYRDDHGSNDKRTNSGKANSGKALFLLFFSIGLILIAFRNDLGLVILFIDSIIATLNYQWFYRIFKWISFISIIFSCAILSNIF